MVFRDSNKSILQNMAKDSRTSLVMLGINGSKSLGIKTFDLGLFSKIRVDLAPPKGCVVYKQKNYCFFYLQKELFGISGCPKLLGDFVLTIVSPVASPIGMLYSGGDLTCSFSILVMNVCYSRAF